MKSIEWLDINVPIEILKIIAIYSTGEILVCQDPNCTKPENEVLMLHSSNLQEKIFLKWNNTPFNYNYNQCDWCHQPLICCSFTKSFYCNDGCIVNALLAEDSLDSE